MGLLFALRMLLLVALCTVLSCGGPVPDSPYTPHHQPHHVGHLGRVKIQAYRGPTKDYFAPWGYFVKQPQDDFKPKYH
ncbi:hypothetical protein FHG87_014989 [Trinorchestia longiramus]|nr:hypothetical protein FHG87_014989 [Trinorchestia longiramus]